MLATRVVPSLFIWLVIDLWISVYDTSAKDTAHTAINDRSTASIFPVSDLKNLIRLEEFIG
ncbi:hypothetical protein [Paenibacillus oralis]|uniref:hypothetical protein n=1 Tax=Paenibacillus oralis TaxID=2490856 RepID=UPI001FE69B9C|nr:hypothetical protein [Paenibacillus oralis]